jgi:hypothetical protein
VDGRGESGEEGAGVSGTIQPWFCEACKIEGDVRLDPAQDVYGAVYKLQDAHKNVSPRCLAGVGKVRIRAPHCTDAEWAAVTKDRKDIALPR